MKEKDIQSEFRRWCKFNWDGGSSAFELKLAKENTLHFSRVEEHQIQALLDAKHGQLFHKISDQSLGYKPFDCFLLTEAGAYLVICFYKPRQPKRVYIIDIDVWVNEVNTAKKKSVNEARCSQLAFKVANLHEVDLD